MDEPRFTGSADTNDEELKNAVIADLRQLQSRQWNAAWFRGAGRPRRRCPAAERLRLDVAARSAARRSAETQARVAEKFNTCPSRPDARCCGWAPGSWCSPNRKQRRSGLPVRLPRHHVVSSPRISTSKLGYRIAGQLDDRGTRNGHAKFFDGQDTGGTACGQSRAAQSASGPAGRWRETENLPRRLRPRRGIARQIERLALRQAVGQQSSGESSAPLIAPGVARRLFGRGLASGAAIGLPASRWRTNVVEIIRTRRSGVRHPFLSGLPIAKPKLRFGKIG